MSRYARLARSVAAALLAGEWTQEDLNRQASRFFGRRQRAGRRRLIRELMQTNASPYPPSPPSLAACLRSSETFVRLASKTTPQRMPLIVLDPPSFAPIAEFSDRGVPKLSAAGDLAAWLETPPEQLDWLSDARRLHRRTDIPVLQHYVYTFAEKRCGHYRLIEAPKPRLRAIQRRILHEILDLLPPHGSAHGFVKGRSCLTAARIHAGERILLTLDLRNFFISIPSARIHAIFRCLGYPWTVARLLTGLCTTMTPVSVFTRGPEGSTFDWQTQQIYGMPHLAQGAPSSPALANLCAWRLDRRLARLSQRFGANYTRYADDLAFSGDETFASKQAVFMRLVDAIIRDEGFFTNGAKSRIMDRSMRQRITGLIVNERLNVPRESYDELKAILHNCAKHGSAGQNRRDLPDFRAHLEGRIAWVEAVNTARGAKLRRIFDRIHWYA
jgi:RNA-directed DNA polymerase